MDTTLVISLALCLADASLELAFFRRDKTAFRWVRLVGIVAVCIIAPALIFATGRGNATAELVRPGVNVLLGLFLARNVYDFYSR